MDWAEKVKQHCLRAGSFLSGKLVVAEMADQFRQERCDGDGGGSFQLDRTAAWPDVDRTKERCPGGPSLVPRVSRDPQRAGGRKDVAAARGEEDQHPLRHWESGDDGRRRGVSV